MCLRFVFLLITRVAAWLRLSRRAERWKTAEILILRHQLAILQRRQPRPETELGGPGPARGPEPDPPGRSSRAPRPRRSWRGFFTAGLPGGTQAYVLAVIEHATRRIRILGVTLHPSREWATQQARHLITDPGEQAHQIKFMIRGRGPNLTA